MDASTLEIRMTAEKGRGLFAGKPISEGSRVVEMQGWLARTDELDDDWLAMQVGEDLWLCSSGELPDDCGNHSCEPNSGFLTGEPVLYALRDIAAGEEICWDYSTSLSVPGWSLECRCSAPNCRRVIRPWQELADADRERLRGIALNYLRSRR